MAKKSVSKKSADRKTSFSYFKSAKKNDFFSQINLGESYTSLILGAIVVVVGLILVFSFLKSKNLMTKQTTSTSTVDTQISTPTVQNPKSYVVKAGDDLWAISEKVYGSGYNWVDIAKANNLENPSVLFSGTRLVLPDVKPRVITQNTQPNAPGAIKGDTYTIEKGDYLWSIAVRAYGDGYKWVDIARVNKLTNPNLIHSGNKLILPR